MPAQAEGALRMRLFGPFEVWLGDRSLSLAFGHSKDAQLLALLSLHPGAMLGHEWLVSRIWPDTLSIESLRQSVIRVRTTLGMQGDRLTTRPGCYGLDLSGADVDVVSFDRAWANPEDDVAALERAVALYRGPLLCDWQDDLDEREPWIEKARKDYEIKFQEALETLTEQAIRNGNWATARRALERLAETRPDDLAPRRKLMAVLIKSQEHLPAKQLFESYREHLRKHGLLPSARMMELYEQIPHALPGVVPDLDPDAVELEPAGGAVPLTSKYYISRAADRDFHTAVARRDSIVLIKGPRQVGKTSLLARGLQQARQDGARVVLTDLQALGAAELATPETFFVALAQSIARQLETSLPDLPDHPTWNPLLSPSAGFQDYLIREVLSRPPGRLVWAIDEADRLFHCAFCNEVFGLFRSWYTLRAVDPNGPWSRLTLTIAYTTEAHLFITDLNQSPFNVGTLVTLRDFTPEQVAALNRLHGEPLRGEAEIGRLLELVGGHPYLVRRALLEMKQSGLEFTAVVAQADREDGMFGGHLRRMRAALCRDAALTEAVRGLLRGAPCPTEEGFYRLSAAGLVAGSSAQDARLRCKLYQIYLKKHLL